MKDKISYTKEEKDFLEDNRNNKLQKFEAEWDVDIKTDEDLVAFYLYELSNQRETPAGLLKKQIEFLSGKEDALLPFMAAIFLHNKAYYLWREQNTVLEAQNLLLKAIEILKTLNGHTIEAYKGRVFDTLGLLMKSESQLKEAAAMFHLAIEHKVKGFDFDGLAISYGNLGRLNMEIGDYVGAIKYLKFDIDLMEEHFADNLFIRAQLLSTLAWAYLEDGQLENAIEKYEESKLMNAEINNPTGLFNNEIGLAEVAIKNQRFKESRRFVNDAHKYLKDEGFFKPAYKSSLVQYSIVHALLLKAELKIAEAKLSLQDLIAHHTASINNIQFAKILLALSDMEEENKKTEYLKKALSILDKTEHVTMRLKVEQQLKEHAKSDFLLHAAGRFAGKEQLERLIDNAGAEGFQGEETELAVLFSDIRGFTTLSEKLSPQELITTLNRFFTLMTKVITDYGGYVDKFIGDAIMAVFSFPKEGEESANKCEQAVRAALHMRSELNRFKTTLGEGLEDLDVGVGIHYGKMVSGIIGSPQKRSFTVIGDAVNTASRLEGLTKQLGASLVVSKEVVDRLEHPDDFIIRPMGAYRPKGKKNPLHLYDIPAFYSSDSWSKEMKKESDNLEVYHKHCEQNELVQAKETLRDLKANGYKAYQAGYHLLGSHLDSLNEHSFKAWDQVINLTSK
jgi:class 3 adenylate cyclase